MKIDEASEEAAMNNRHNLQQLTRRGERIAALRVAAPSLRVKHAPHSSCRRNSSPAPLQTTDTALFTSLSTGRKRKMKQNEWGGRVDFKSRINEP